MKPTAKSAKNYFKALASEKRATLEKLRKTILSAAPGAEEYVSYGLPSFRFEGRPLVAIGAAKNHCALYPMDGSLVTDHTEELAGYETSKGTIRFTEENPLPAALVKKLVKARIAQNRLKKTG